MQATATATTATAVTIVRQVALPMQALAAMIGALAKSSAINRPNRTASARSSVRHSPAPALRPMRQVR